MPELPEVETVVNELAEYISDKVLTDFTILHSLAKMEDFDESTLIGAHIKSVQRRAKYIIISFSNRDFYLIAHLRMTGKFVTELDEKDMKHVTASFWLNDKSEWHFVDVRKFGGFSLTYDIKEYFRDFGPEPFQNALTFDYLKQKLKKTNRYIKTVIMDQKVISGLGNIYADEALFLSKIHPLFPASSLDDESIFRLKDAIIITIDRAINNMGTSLSDYRRTKNIAGENQNYLNVYGLNGKECNLCETIIKKIKLGGRGTHFCPKCQNMEQVFEEN